MLTGTLSLKLKNAGSFQGNVDLRKLPMLSVHSESILTSENTLWMVDMCEDCLTLIHPIISIFLFSS